MCVCKTFCFWGEEDEQDTRKELQDQIGNRKQKEGKNKISTDDVTRWHFKVCCAL